MKKLLIAAFLLILNVSLYSQSHKDTQVLQSGHWIYSDLYTLSTEAQKSYFIDSQPLTIGELKFYFSEIEYDSLSQSGKTLYNKIQSFFDKNGELKGILCAVIKIDKLFGLTEGIDIEENSTAYMVDRNGRFLIHPDRSYIGKVFVPKNEKYVEIIWIRIKFTFTINND